MSEYIEGSNTETTVQFLKNELTSTIYRELGLAATFHVPCRRKKHFRALEWIYSKSSARTV
jgi:hypothetical protein